MGYASLPENMQQTTEVDDVQVHEAVLLDEPELKTPKTPELCSIDLGDTQDVTFEGYGHKSSNSTYDIWNDNKQSTESSAEKAWRNSYISQNNSITKYEVPLKKSINKVSSVATPKSNQLTKTSVKTK